jgi:imidazolonepropionase-like amidohydrolase
MSPYEALRAGTADAARSLSAASEFGTATEGSRADLVLLEANPLKDVRNAARIAGVMAAGRWYPISDLHRDLMALKASYGEM